MLGLILLVQALTVAIGGVPGSPEYLPVRVADSAGDFTREGLTVTLRQTRAVSGAAEALAQGQADIAATSLEAVLRFGNRPPAPAPKLVFGLSAAPPVALVVATQGPEVKSLEALAGGRIGFATPGGAEQTWMQAVLARAHLGPGQVELVSLGSRGVIGALESGEVRAAIVAEPAASAVIEEGRASVLVDLRSPHAVARTLGVPTVNAAVFVRGDRRIDDRQLTAFARALLAAERRIATDEPASLAEGLPKAVVGTSDEFARRVVASRTLTVANGAVERDAVRATIEMIRTHLPLPSWLRVPRPEEILHLEPLRRALRAKPPA